MDIKDAEKIRDSFNTLEVLLEIDDAIGEHNWLGLISPNMIRVEIPDILRYKLKEAVRDSLKEVTELIINY